MNKSREFIVGNVRLNIVQSTIVIILRQILFSSLLIKFFNKMIEFFLFQSHTYRFSRLFFLLLNVFSINVNDQLKRIFCRCPSVFHIKEKMLTSGANILFSKKNTKAYYRMNEELLEESF